ncbi:hypothetical protein Tsubulata_036854 [Turnera subulata]|uniref:Uncharacterized protein n=1 Tax=Turnera subulata TaxID=218843 RepID=A0A9Q0JED2_9ROSI|nr:hypothetical protein Tsubulata_036854 [Turnera subulata]
MHVMKTRCWVVSSRPHNASGSSSSSLLQASVRWILLVWNGLEKENKEFFQAYEQSKSKGVRMSKEEMRQLILDISEESSGQNFVEWRIKSNQEQSARGN